MLESFADPDRDRIAGVKHLLIDPVPALQEAVSAPCPLVLWRRKTLKANRTPMTIRLSLPHFCANIWTSTIPMIVKSSSNPL